MKYFFILVVGSEVFMTGCKYSPEPETNKLGPSITVTSNWSPSLDGGGRWFDGADTGVWYDATLSFTLNNTSGSVKDISYKLEIGGYKNGKFQKGGGELFYDGDSVVSGSSKIGGSTTLDITPTIGVGRKNLSDWSYPYGYRLTLTDIATNDSYVNEGSFDGSKPENRFHGIIYTSEFSPDSLGSMDGYDDGDWRTNRNPDMGADPCFPNPAVGNSLLTTARFTVQNKDSVVMTINKTKNYILRKILSDIKNPGTYELQIVMDSLKEGQYRVYYHFVDSMRVYNSHGDIKYVRH